MSYIVTPHETPTWKITPLELSTLFHRDWKVIEEKIPDPINEKIKGFWKIQFGAYTTSCSVFDDCVALHTDGDLCRSLLLAFWYRQFVPSEIRLFLYNSDGNELVEITKPSEEGSAFKILCT